MPRDLEKLLVIKPKDDTHIFEHSRSTILNDNFLNKALFLRDIFVPSSTKKSIDSAFLSSIIYKPLSNGYYIFETVKKQKEDNSSDLHKEQGEQKVRSSFEMISLSFVVKAY